jgi:hypothetical protein
MHCISYSTLTFLVILLTLVNVGRVTGNQAPTLKISPHIRHPDAQWGHADGFVRLAKNLYRDLDAKQGNLTVIADQYQGEFDRLNETTKGQLGDSLSALFAIRVLDLQNSILHTRKMQELLSSLMKK